jgi:hypothetical protein
VCIGVHVSETEMSQKCGPREELQKIALSFLSAFSANFLADSAVASADAPSRLG